MDQPSRATSDAIVVDLASQLACLRDALATGNAHALASACAAVARAQGLGLMADSAGVSRSKLVAALAKADCDDADALRAFVVALLDHLTVSTSTRERREMKKQRLQNDETEQTRGRY